MQIVRVQYSYKCEWLQLKYMQSRVYYIPHTDTGTCTDMNVNADSGNVIPIYDFCCFLYMSSLHVAVNMCINYSFLHFIVVNSAQCMQGINTL